MKNNILLVLLMLILGLMSLIGIHRPAFGRDKAIELKFSHLFPTTHIANRLVNEWAAEIEKRTSGRLKIIMYPASSLVSPRDSYDAAITNICDITVLIPSYYPGRFPIHNTTALPIGYPKSPLAMYHITRDIHERHPEEWKGLKEIGLFTTYYKCIYTKKPVRRMEDFKGMRMKVPGGTSTQKIKILGATPIALPVSETYEALQKGIVGGMVTSPDVLEGYRMAELLKYIILPPLDPQQTFMTVAMNRRRYKSLPPDVQNIIAEYNEEWSLHASRLWFDAGKRSIYEYAVPQAGMKIITISPEERARWDKAFEPIVDQWVKKELNARGLPGKEILAEVIELHKKYDHLTW